MSNFSVIIPAYNAERTVRRAIGSVLAQTHAPHEVIVCDDGSTDATAELVSAYPSVTLVRQENRGPAAARNRAVREATGDVLVLLDADDEWQPGRLGAIAALLDERPDVALVTTDAWVEGGETRRRYYGVAPFPRPEDQPIAILSDNFMFVSSAIRAAAWREVGGFDESVRPDGDYHLWIKLVLAGYRAARVDEPLAIYHVTVGSVSSDRPSSYRGVIAMLRNVDETFELSDEQRTALRGHVDRLDSRLGLVEAHRALVQGHSTARRLSLTVALDRRQPGKRRLKYLAACVIPAIGR